MRHTVGVRQSVILTRKLYYAAFCHSAIMSIYSTMRLSVMRLGGVQLGCMWHFTTPPCPLLVQLKISFFSSFSAAAVRSTNETNKAGLKQSIIFRCLCYLRILPVLLRWFFDIRAERKVLFINETKWYKIWLRVKGQVQKSLKFYRWISLKFINLTFN